MGIKGSTYTIFFIYLTTFIIKEKCMWRGGEGLDSSSSLSRVVVDKPIIGYNQVPAPLSSTPILASPWLLV